MRRCENRASVMKTGVGMRGVLQCYIRLYAFFLQSSQLRNRETCVSFWWLPRCSARVGLKECMFDGMARDAQFFRHRLIATVAYFQNSARRQRKATQTRIAVSARDIEQRRCCFGRSFQEGNAIRCLYLLRL